MLSYAADTMQVCREKHLDRDTRRDGRDGLGVESLVLITLSTQHEYRTASKLIGAASQGRQTRSSDICASSPPPQSVCSANLVLVKPKVLRQ